MLLHLFLNRMRHVLQPRLSTQGPTLQGPAMEVQQAFLLPPKLRATMGGTVQTEEEECVWSAYQYQHTRKLRLRQQPKQRHWWLP